MTHVNMKRLTYFVALAEALHFGRAADDLGISQPALSGEIKKLEEELGLTLFARKPYTTLTNEGTLMARRARNLLEAADRFSSGAAELSSGIAGSVTIGCVPTFFIRGLLEAVAELEATWPGIVIHIREMNTADQLELLDVGGIDIALSHGPGQGPSLERVRVASEQFLVCAPPGMEVRALTDLRSVPFVTFRREVSPHYWEKVMAICRAADVEPQVRHQAMTWGAVLSLTRQGMGVSLLPSLIADQAPELVSRDVATGDVRSDSWLVMRSEDSASAIGQVFAELRHHFGSVPPL